MKTTKANVRDLVTESDVECQRLIRDIILKEFPEDVFWGEEDVDVNSLGGGATSDVLKEALRMSGGHGLESGIGGSEDRLLFVVVSTFKIFFQFQFSSLLEKHNHAHFHYFLHWIVQDPIDGTTNFQAGETRIV